MNTSIHSKQLNTIYQSLSALNILELDEVMQQIITIRRRKLPSVLTQSETELLRKINIGAPLVIQKRYNYLLKERKKETLTQEENGELLELTAYMENFSVKRLECLIELAKLRNLSLDELLDQLEIKPRVYVA